MGWKSKKLDAMDYEDINDVHLVGTDGEEVPCCKAILATTSPVFRSMFFRGFKEQQTDRCSLDFHSLVISLIVKYCYCGEVDMDLIFGNNKSIEEEATLLVELREAGRYFEIEDFISAAEAKIGNLVFRKTNDKKMYQYPPAFLTELFKRDGDEDPLGHAIYQFVAENTIECFCPRGPENGITNTYQAHPSVLSKVLKRNKDVYAVVRCIQAWSSVGNDYSDEEKRVLIDIAENVDLKILPTEELSTIKPSSFFSSERILEAFVHQCKSSEIIVETPRTKPRLHISGAATEHLNGFYRPTAWKGEPLNAFHKYVEHNGKPCFSIIHRIHGGSKWLISITQNTSLRDVKIGNDDKIGEGSFQTHVYEAPCQSLPTDNPKLPPFSGWKCVEGTGTAPFVACIYH